MYTVYSGHLTSIETAAHLGVSTPQPVAPTPDSEVRQPLEQPESIACKTPEAQQTAVHKHMQVKHSEQYFFQVGRVAAIVLDRRF